jgi:polysaccharide biosynthesis transport protein
MNADNRTKKDAATVDIGEIVHLFRDNLGKTMLITVATVGIAGLYLHNTQPVYVSKALLEVGAVDQQKPSAADPDASDTLRTIELEIVSQSVLERVVLANHLAIDPEFATQRPQGEMASRAAGDPIALNLTGSPRQSEWDGLLQRIGIAQSAPAAPATGAELVDRLRKRVDVDLVRGSRLISLQVEAHAPDKATQLAQAIIDGYFQQSLEDRQKNANSERNLLVAEARRVGQDYKASQETLEAYRAKYNAVSLQDRQNIVVERLKDLNVQVATAKNTRLALEAEKAQADRQAGADPESLLSLHSVAELPEVVDLRKQTSMQEAQVANLAKRFGPLHPSMIQAKSQLAELHNALDASIREASYLLNQSYEAAKATEASLESALADQEKAALELDRIAIPYHALERETQADSDMYQRILDGLKQFDAAHRTMSAYDIKGLDIRVIERPSIPSQPSRPRTKLLLALSLAAGLFLGCGSALVSRAMDNSVSSVDDAESLLGLPVLSAVARSRHRRLTSSPLVLASPSSTQAEAFRSLRTKLALLPNEADRRCTLVTSAVPGEGKSFCSLNLAATFAQQGLRTLLIDADLRRPGLQSLFVSPCGRPGISECLADPTVFASAVLPTPVPNLSCLGDWTPKRRGSELLAKNGLHEILRQAREGFERVVVDTAPLLAVSDTLHLAREIPTICLVVRAGKTPQRLVIRALKLLKDVAQQSATGVILNKFNYGSGSYYYYYGN